MPSAFVQWMQHHQRPISYVDDTDRLGQARQRLGIKINTPAPAPTASAPPATPPPLDDGMVLSGRDLSRYRDVPYADIFQEAGSKYGVDPALLMAMAKQESGFNPQAVSPASAQGVLQLMPGTAREMGVTNPFDPYDNIMGGAKYMRWIMDYTKSDNPNDWLHSYNAGPGNWRNGVLPQETQTYLTNVNNYWQQYR